MVRYEETVNTYRWLTLLGFVATGGFLVGSGLVFADDGSSLTGRLVVGIVLVVTSILWLSLSVIFTKLRIKVSDDSVRFHFGPFGRLVPSSEIDNVEVEPYRWLVYGGWGIRFSTKKRQAFSLPGHPVGVAIITSRGTRYHVSSKDPDTFASAIRTLLGGKEQST